MADAGAPRQSLQTIRDAVHEFVLADRSEDPYPPEVRVGRLDKRLRLKPCPAPLQVTYANADRRAGQVYATVACTGEVAWRIFVPVRVAAFADVVVAARALPRGQRLGAADLRLAKRDLAGLNHGYYRDPAELQAWETRRSVRAGTVLTPTAVAPRKLVRNGEAVTLVAAAGRLRVAARGKALGDGAEGHTVRVRNSATGRVVEGRVIGPGRVAVDW